LGCYRLVSNNGHVLLRTETLLDELDGTIDQREQGVILAQANVGARTNRGAALTDDDAAGVDCLAAVDFNAEAFAFESRPLRVVPPPFLCAI